MTARLDLLTERVALTPGDDVVLLLDGLLAGPEGDGSLRVRVTHLGEPVLDTELAPGPADARGRRRVALGPLPAGSYAVAVGGPGVALTTGLDVLDDRARRLRYGFVADFRPGRDDFDDLADWLRAAHLTHVQLYDWMYRHAALLPPDAHTLPAYDDALGRPLSLATVRAVVETVRAVGGRSIAYAAVYGAGREYATAHPEQVLRRRGGAPWTLADFLWVMDVSPGSAWVRHVVREMGAAVEAVGFDGLHLDQYGDPKVALDARGRVVDLAAAFPALVDAVRDRLPRTTLVFNNVGGFPVWSTAAAAQDATYVEVWPPRTGLVDLAALVADGRERAPGRPVVLAAYLTPFARGSGPREVAGAQLALATVWLSGGQSLLLGEVAGVLTDPYYPRHGSLDAAAVAALRAWTDFAVATADVLDDPGARDLGPVLVGGVNRDVVLLGADGEVPHGPSPRAGEVWVRPSEVDGRLVVSLLDLRGQADTRWDAPHEALEPATGLRLRLRLVAERPRAVVGHPGGGPALHEAPVRDAVPGVDGDDAAPGGGEVVVDLPPFTGWCVLVVDR
ncbi:glycoside hydrolase family 66 protein [Lapillicoccus jejuensis]|uniref:Dextranase n=1 Tax=Lapillicoccus jejuensis TaxID=402171 RepID=A0A542DWY0_9MICO|nr:glycoside hydrolase family 66 protein [Lapillicoccus jejuensis]TQJ07424.1 dextranase [Lapillicoccus jejuensis]